MIYGQLAKSMSSTRGGVVVSESDAIIKFLQQESNEYRNSVLNESYLSNEERIVYEAKIEALNEAVTGAIIAAIVAAVGALIALVAKIISTLSSGQQKLSSAASKAVNSSTKSSTSTNSNSSTGSGTSNTSGSGNSSKSQSTTSRKWGQLSSDEKNKVLTKILSDSKLKGVSTIDFTQVINCGAMRELCEAEKILNDIVNNQDNYTPDEVESKQQEALSKIKCLSSQDLDDIASVDTSGDINELYRIGDHAIINKSYQKAFDDNAKNLNGDPKLALTKIYNDNLVNIDSVFSNPDQYKSSLDKLYSASISKLKVVQSDLKELEGLTKKEEAYRKARTEKDIEYYKSVNAEIEDENGHSRKMTEDDFNDIRKATTAGMKIVKTILSRYGKTLSGWQTIENARTSIIVQIVISSVNPEKYLKNED
jgi:hypothetical protein